MIIRVGNVLGFFFTIIPVAPVVEWLRKQRSPFIKEAKEKRGNTFDYSKVEYKGAGEPICVICNVCGTENWPRAFAHLNGNGCLKCLRLFQRTTEQFIEESNEMHGVGRFDYSKAFYTRRHDAVLIICNLCKREFWQDAGSHLMGIGCSFCSTPRHDLNKYKELAHKSGGEYIFDTCPNISTAIVEAWRCNKGHTWSASYNRIYLGAWCPYCSSLRSETTARTILQRLFNLPFKKVNPPFLQKMQLDGYCEPLKIAFEYQGRQHYKYVKYFHPTVEHFNAQLERDTRKKKICEEQGISLICIPYLYNFSTPDEMESFILADLREKGISIPLNLCVQLKSTSDGEIEVSITF